jgi:hypothetical protein
MRTPLTVILAVLAVLLAMGIAGSFDYEDALAQEQRYCENVFTGVWPAYANIDCGQYYDENRERLEKYR